MVANSLAVPTMPIPGKWGLILPLVRSIMMLAAPRISTWHKVNPLCYLNACTGADDLLLCPDNRSKLIARSGSSWIVVFSYDCAAGSFRHQSNTCVKS